MRTALSATAVASLLACLAVPASAQDVEGVRQIDRVCMGRMLIVQTMSTVKERGKSEQEYRSENLFNPQWSRAMREEVSAVISYVWSHTHEENVEFSNAVMEACYGRQSES